MATHLEQEIETTKAKLRDLRRKEREAKAAAIAKREREFGKRIATAIDEGLASFTAVVTAIRSESFTAAEIEAPASEGASSEATSDAANHAGWGDRDEH